jgi:hypothetical protein
VLVSTAVQDGSTGLSTAPFWAWLRVAGWLALPTVALLGGLVVLRRRVWDAATLFVTECALANAIMLALEVRGYATVQTSPWFVQTLGHAALCLGAVIAAVGARAGAAPAGEAHGFNLATAAGRRHPIGFQTSRTSAGPRCRAPFSARQMALWPLLVTLPLILLPRDVIVAVRDLTISLWLAAVACGLLAFWALGRGYLPVAALLFGLLSALSAGVPGLDAPGRCAVQRDTFAVVTQSSDVIERHATRESAVLWYDSTDTLPIPGCPDGYRMIWAYQPVEQVTQVGWRTAPIPPADRVEPSMLKDASVVVVMAPLDVIAERERMMLERLPGSVVVDGADVASGRVRVAVRLLTVR